METQISTRFTWTLIFTTLLVSCHNGPREIQSGPVGTSNGSENIVLPPGADHPRETAGKAFGNELHQVLVKEILPTSRYVYARVEEAGKTFWIATRKKEINTGEMYFYRGGLLKTMFESKEYNKMFDTIYLVSSLVSRDHSKHLNTVKEPASIPDLKTITEEDLPKPKMNSVVHNGTVKISDLVQNPAKYEGHRILISGKCVKINPNIMDRNWIHVQDGSRDDYDLVVTSASYIPEGKEFTMKATVHLNRDFGAGYTYDLILEDGELQ